MITRISGAVGRPSGIDRSGSNGEPGNRLIPEPGPVTDNPREES